MQPNFDPNAGQKPDSPHTETQFKIWIGGVSGQSSNWCEPRNWFPVGVPGWNDKVLIGGYQNHTCVISEAVDDIAGLLILERAALHISPGGKLFVDGLLSATAGPLGETGVYIDGVLVNRGTIHLRNVSCKSWQNTGRVLNQGKIYLAERCLHEHVVAGKICNEGSILTEPYRYLGRL